jgi:Zn-dependent M28 family amino/carboxypeptidase
LGIVEGADPVLKREYVVFTGHLDGLGAGTPMNGDAIYNGAYDNALGTALLIELARELANGPERPRRSILFASVTAEEKGLLGSDYLARFPPVPREQIVANINLDMPLFFAPVRGLLIRGIEHSSLRRPAETAAASLGFVIEPDPTPEEASFIRSDQYSFVRQGVPALSATPGITSPTGATNLAGLRDEFLKTRYHKPSDDLRQTIDWGSVRLFFDFELELVRRVANDPERPRWNTGDFFGQRYAERKP